MPAKWRCIVCGYVHVGEEPPEICPICGATKDQFEKIEG
ncbi:rubredoxin-like domain-containing protein [Chloroflexota bacterium]